MSGNEENVCVVADKLSEMCGLTGKFITNELISVHGFQPVLSTSRDVPTKFANTSEVNVFHISQAFALDDSVLRGLVSESSSIFYNLQTAKDKTSEFYLHTSRSYRSAIRATLNKLREAIDDEDSNSDDVKKYENFVTIFYSIECSWHLCEFLLIDSSSISTVPNLLEWTKFHFPSPSQNAAEMLINLDRDVDVRSNYWVTVKGLILQGQIDIARALLKLHSSSETMTFQLAEKDLQSMPIFSSHGGLSLQKFRSQWSYWSTTLISKIDSGLYSTEPDLEDIMKLITGDKATWMEVCKDSNCWYEHFAGFLFFTQPSAKYFELGASVNSWLSQWASSKGSSGFTNLNHLERMVLAVLKNDMAEFIHSIQDIADNKWFVVHLTDLLVHCDQLRMSNEGDNTSLVIALRENLIYDYGAMLMSRGSLWEIGMDYLEFSSSEGLGAREILLQRIPIKNDLQATNVIAVARRHGLAAIEQDICRVMVKRSMSLHNYGNALEWAIRSRDNIYVTKVANVFLFHYCKTGKMLHKDLLAHVGAKMFISPRLLFLVKYFDFHRYFSSRALAQAAELLVNLLDSKIIPEFFWPSLLADAIPLLEHNEPIIPSKETYIIMHHLESNLIPFIEKKNRQRENINTDHGDDIELNLIDGYPDDLVQLLRLACARNLSRAMIIENTLIH
ncbi:CLUMA_CG008265, isoform A [Clunio marinus]|uniref:Nuclear pore complex protein Nup85 n=1 Tax=Clunio marinus TaxID=568069 RepID=A0A1J1I3J6_9DIPT|nr:CLUMA_CG008265, isoform A [Clunio marinus]